MGTSGYLTATTWAQIKRLKESTTIPGANYVDFEGLCTYWLFVQHLKEEELTANKFRAIPYVAVNCETRGSDPANSNLQQSSAPSNGVCTTTV